jgi:hypothetical protein
VAIQLGQGTLILPRGGGRVSNIVLGMSQPRLISHGSSDEKMGANLHGPYLPTPYFRFLRRALQLHESTPT